MKTTFILGWTNPKATELLHFPAWNSLVHILPVMCTCSQVTKTASVDIGALNQRWIERSDSKEYRLVLWTESKIQCNNLTPQIGHATYLMNALLFSVSHNYNVLLCKTYSMHYVDPYDTFMFIFNVLKLQSMFIVIAWKRTRKPSSKFPFFLKEKDERLGLTIKNDRISIHY